MVGVEWIKAETVRVNRAVSVFLSKGGLFSSLARVSADNFAGILYFYDFSDGNLSCCLYTGMKQDCLKHMSDNKVYEIVLFQKHDEIPLYFTVFFVL